MNQMGPENFGLHILCKSNLCSLLKQRRGRGGERMRAEGEFGVGKLKIGYPFL